MAAGFLQEGFRFENADAITINDDVNIHPET